MPTRTENYLGKLSSAICCLTVVCVALIGIKVEANSSAADLATSQSAIGAQQAQDSASVVLVTTSRHSKDRALINDYVTLDDIAGFAGSTSELISQQPGVSVNGQPGLFQTVSIRGLGRQRVQVYFNGMRMTSERRAGVAASFIDPLLLSGAEITQGPAATYYGSGAIGGSIHLISRQPESNWLHSGRNSDGNEWVTAAGSGNENFTAGVAFRQRDNGETIQGQPKNNHFSQRSLIYSRNFQLNDYKLEWQILAARGWDIGKDNIRFPASRITSYPEENHWLSQLILSSQQDWVAKLYWHDQDLTTREVRPQIRSNQVTTGSLDMGFSVEDRWRWQAYSGLIGIDYFGRRNVNSVERETDLNSLLNSQFSSLENAQENETAVFATLNRQIDSWSFHGGLRINFQSQKSEISESVEDSYQTYFLVAEKSFDDLKLSVSYATGFRFASLSERLFNGTTARGKIIGNADLKPEESQSIDIGMDYQSKSWSFAVHRFFNRVDHFIERQPIDLDILTFVNLAKASLRGWQYQFDFTANDQFSIALSGQGIDAKNQVGEPLSDVPAKRHQINFKYHHGNWFSHFNYQYRLADSVVAQGEQMLESAKIASLKIGYEINRKWTVQVALSNLLDQRYYNSADDLGTLAAGRHFGVAVNYAG